MIADPAIFAWVLVAAFGSAIVGGMGGFGTGVILTAVLIPIIGVKAVVPVLSLAGILINAGRFWFYRRDVNWAVLQRVLPAAIPFVYFGTLIYEKLDPRPLGVLIACVLIASIPLRRYLKSRNIQVGPNGQLAGGALFGLTNGFASGMGILLVSLLLGAGLSGTAVLATDALITIFIDLLRAALFGRVNLLTWDAALLGLMIGIATLPGSWVASLLVNRMGAKLHVVFIEGLIVVGSLLIAFNSLRG